MMSSHENTWRTVDMTGGIYINIVIYNTRSRVRQDGRPVSWTDMFLEKKDVYSIYYTINCSHETISQRTGWVSPTSGEFCRYTFHDKCSKDGRMKWWVRIYTQQRWLPAMLAKKHHVYIYIYIRSKIYRYVLTINTDVKWILSIYI